MIWRICPSRIPSVPLRYNSDLEISSISRYVPMNVPCIAAYGLCSKNPLRKTDTDHTSLYSSVIFFFYVRGRKGKRRITRKRKKRKNNTHTSNIKNRIEFSHSSRDRSPPIYPSASTCNQVRFWVFPRSFDDVSRGFASGSRSGSIIHTVSKSRDLKVNYACASRLSSAHAGWPPDSTVVRWNVT